MSEQERVEAARKMGQARSEKKQKASAVSLEKARTARWTPEAKAAHAEKMREFWRNRTRKPAGEEESGE